MRHLDIVRSQAKCGLVGNKISSIQLKSIIHMSYQDDAKTTKIVAECTGDELKQAAQGILYWLTYEIFLKQAHGRHYGSHINEIALLVHFRSIYNFYGIKLRDNCKSDCLYILLAIRERISP